MKIKTLISILRLCEIPTTSTHIFRILNYSYDSIRDYTEHLVKHKLLSESISTDKRKKLFKITSKGK
jgi:predicted transcriptional regulator